MKSYVEPWHTALASGLIVGICMMLPPILEHVTRSGPIVLPSVTTHATPTVCVSNVDNNFIMLITTTATETDTCTTVDTLTDSELEHLYQFMHKSLMATGTNINSRCIKYNTAASIDDWRLRNAATADMAAPFERKNLVDAVKTMSTLIKVTDAITASKSFRVAMTNIINRTHTYAYADDIIRFDAAATMAKGALKTGLLCIGH